MEMNEISVSCSLGTDAIFSESTFKRQVASFVKFFSKCTVPHYEGSNLQRDEPSSSIKGMEFLD